MDGVIPRYRPQGLPYRDIREFPKDGWGLEGERGMTTTTQHQSRRGGNDGTAKAYGRTDPEDDGEGPRHGGLLRELLFLGTELAGIHVRVGDALFHADAVGFFEGDVLKLQLKLVPQKNIDGTPYLFSVSKLES